MPQLPPRLLLHANYWLTRPVVARFAFVISTALAFVLVLAGCSLFPPPPDPYAEVRHSWNEGFWLPDNQLAAMPFYSITTRVDVASGLYTGTLDLRLPVSSTRPMRELYFRTYPRLLVFDGDLQLTGAWVDGTTVAYSQAAEGTALRLNLVTPLESGKDTEIRLLFHGEYQQDREADQYTIFGQSNDTVSLAGFYPILAAQRGGEWALDLPHPQGDVGFHEAAVYRVALTVPPGQTIIATGTEITRTVEVDGWVTALYALGPAREFAVLLSPVLRVMEGETLGTRVRSYYHEPDMDAARKALNDGIAALQVYTDAFGPYPYRDMAIVQAPLTFHGMEFPSVNLIGSQVYNQYVKDLENLVVHEIAHQWWYNQVGSDQIRTPWLDEGLAEFSMYTYYRGRYGPRTAEALRTLRWQLPVDSIKRRGKDMPIGLPVVDYKENYEPLVYGKGALFFATLRDEMGEVKFDRLLREYYLRYRWKIANEQEFQALAEEIAAEDFSALFNAWVYR
jgi:hypothetical protein